MAARAVEGGTRTHGQLDSPVNPQPASAEFGQRLIKVGDTVQEDRRVARQMLGEHLLAGRALGRDAEADGRARTRPGSRTR